MAESIARELDNKLVDSSGPAFETASAGSERKVNVPYVYSPVLPEILTHLKASLLVSTYQAGKVLVIGAHEQRLRISFLELDQPMGIAVAPDRIAIGSRSEVRFFGANHDAASSVKPQKTFDGCYVAHSSRHTGKILGHDLGWGSEGLWVVNTLFSCLCTLDESHSFVPRWKPKFISGLADEDRCHLNGLAMENGMPRYVTALAETDTKHGWRADKARSGCLIDVHNGEILLRGLAMPHSPRINKGNLWVLDSGRGALARVDRNNGSLETVEHVPGYTRGLALHGQFAFVGLSRIRETNVFGGLPISERREQLCCGVAVIDLISGRSVATFQFLEGVEEIFAVDVIPNRCHPVFGGVSNGVDQQEIWVVPGAANSVPNAIPPRLNASS